MKNVYYTTTTDFYKNPSKAISIVNEGGTVYLTYKKLKEPIAVLTGYDDYKSTKEAQDRKKDRLKILSKYQSKSKYWRSGTELQKEMRQ